MREMATGDVLLRTQRQTDTQTPACDPCFPFTSNEGAAQVMPVCVLADWCTWPCVHPLRVERCLPELASSASSPFLLLPLLLSSPFRNPVQSPHTRPR